MDKEQKLKTLLKIGPSCITIKKKKKDNQRWEVDTKKIVRNANNLVSSITPKDERNMNNL